MCSNLKDSLFRSLRKLLCCLRDGKLKNLLPPKQGVGVDAQHVAKTTTRISGAKTFEPRHMP